MSAYKNQMNIDRNGELQEWMKDDEMGLVCENGNCLRKDGQNYNRIKAERTKGWENEPIFLCKKHSKLVFRYRKYVAYLLAILLLIYIIWTLI